ncbi:MAG: ATP-binding protein [bacterium]|nr:ATP-binding protein [bacterium]
MSVITIILIFTLLLNAMIMYLVYKSNPKRLPNKTFVLACANVWLWIACFLFIVNASSVKSIESWVKVAFALGSFIPFTFLIFVDSIVGNKKFRRKEYLMVMFFSIAEFFLSFSPNLFTGFKKPASPMQMIPEATYGWPYLLWYSLFFLAIIFDFIILSRSMKNEKGLKKAELQYILFGWFFAAIFIVFSMVIFPIIFKTSFLVQFTPISVLIMNGFIGYGIARYKIMDVSVLMQKVLSYSFLILSIFLLYNLSLFSLRWFLLPRLPEASILPDTLALLLIVFIFEPARKRISNFVNFKIFNLEYSPEDILRGLEKVLYTVGDIRIFLERCLKVVLESTGIKEGKIFFIPVEGHSKNFVISISLQGQITSDIDIYPEKIEQVMRIKAIPLIKGELERKIPEETTTAIIEEMREINAEIVLPLLSDDKLLGILCFGEKVSGKFFSPEDEEVFSRLSYYLSLKMQNFLFYQEIERERIYQETLLENLPIGVIGTDASGYINIVNREAENITGLNKKDIERRYFSEVLPEEIRKILTYSIQNKKDVRYLHFKMKKEGRDISLNANASLFYDKDGGLLGAQIIFSDVTHLEELEEGIKRAERLASLGVMATGIAHEIKNPLVSIKTFAQLLQEKYNDSDFREQFSSLAIKEVDRINALVEDILMFAKPRGIVWVDVDIKELIRATKVLLTPQFPDKKIEIKEDLCDEPVVIKGDADRLKQALLNLCINSAQAIDKEGTINIKVSKGYEIVRIEIKDDGCGIKEDILSKIFEPFFTTKTQGTGLGLSIVARIIDEHNGNIKIESMEGKGTTVCITLPVRQKENEGDELFASYNRK